MRKLLLAIVLLAGCSNSAGKVTLVVYSPHGKELLTEFERLFEQANPNVDVRWLDMGSQNALDRIRSEKSNPQADVWFGAPSTMFSQAAKEGLLDAYAPTWAGQVDQESRSPDDFWYGTYQTPEVIAYNTEMVSEADAPRDWDDILDPKWKGKVVIRDPIASGTMRAIYSAMILRFPDAAGSAETGYAWLRKLNANTKEYVNDAPMMFQKLGRQEAAITLWNMPDIELQKSQYKYPFAYVVPASGTPVLTEGLAIVKGTKHPNEARAYYEFVSSADSLATAAHKFYRIPTRRDVEKSKLPEWMRNLDFPRMPMNWDMVESKSKEWMEYWDTHIRGGQ